MTYEVKKPTKRTYWMITINNDYCHSWTLVRKITCEVTGQMASGALVWTDVETGEQYFCSRMLGHYYFYHI